LASSAFSVLPLLLFFIFFVLRGLDGLTRDGLSEDHTAVLQQFSSADWFFFF
jgi:hypothetical protein